jgi:hypothetical protein
LAYLKGLPCFATVFPFATALFFGLKQNLHTTDQQPFEISGGIFIKFDSNFIFFSSSALGAEQFDPI